ncbi:MAG: hypothetical protein FVQ83_04740 [Chloroflexi bacterium]|nr:hypothetical protein [Chloroflexota bacterium]
MGPSSIAAINRLPTGQQREIYCRLIPDQLIDQFNIHPSYQDGEGNDLLIIDAPVDSYSVEMSLFHQHGFPDPLLYGHMTDTANGQIHVLLYIINDPNAPRFNVDRLPDGSSTKYGTQDRNLAAEEAAMKAGLLPGQIRQGLRLLSNARLTFEDFIKSLEHNIYFVEPLYYHNAIIFERYGLNYQSGRKRMEWINDRFSDGGDLVSLLDNSAFRLPEAAKSIRLRSWAIHDGILGEPFTEVTMYKIIDKPAGLITAPGISW